MKEYTEEDVRKAFYKGRETKILPDGSKIFIRPTFNGYLRELDGEEDAEKEFEKRVKKYNEEESVQILDIFYNKPDISARFTKEKEIFRKFKDILNAFDGLDENNIKMENKLKDIGLDSVDIIEVVMGCEAEFDIHIDDKLLSEIQNWTIGDFISFLTKEL